jgi:AcrR family transcriptional regulator
VSLDGVLAALASDDPSVDDFVTAVLDATEALLRTAGLSRWSVDDVADRAGVGRTSVYRRFGERDQLVYAVLARELKATVARIFDAAAGATDLESQATAAVSAALSALDTSVVQRLLRSDPAIFLPFLTTEAGPLLAIARHAIGAQLSAIGIAAAPELAEVAARIGLSFILTRDTVLPVDDPAALDEAVRRTLRPLMAAVGLATLG